MPTLNTSMSINTTSKVTNNGSTNNSTGTNMDLPPIPTGNLNSFSKNEYDTYNNSKKKSKDSNYFNNSSISSSVPANQSNSGLPSFFSMSPSNQFVNSMPASDSYYNSMENNLFSNSFNSGPSWDREESNASILDSFPYFRYFSFPFFSSSLVMKVFLWCPILIRSRMTQMFSQPIAALCWTRRPIRRVPVLNILEWEIRIELVFLFIFLVEFHCLFPIRCTNRPTGTQSLPTPFLLLWMQAIPILIQIVIIWVLLPQSTSSTLPARSWTPAIWTISFPILPFSWMNKSRQVQGIMMIWWCKLTVSPPIWTNLTTMIWVNSSDRFFFLSFCYLSCTADFFVFICCHCLLFPVNLALSNLSSFLYFNNCTIIHLFSSLYIMSFIYNEWWSLFSCSHLLLSFNHFKPSSVVDVADKTQKKQQLLSHSSHNFKTTNCSHKYDSQSNNTLYSWWPNGIDANTCIDEMFHLIV